jgi:hypothetical protein
MDGTMDGTMDEQANATQRRTQVSLSSLPGRAVQTFLTGNAYKYSHNIRVVIRLCIHTHTNTLALSLARPNCFEPSAIHCMNSWVVFSSKG